MDPVLILVVLAALSVIVLGVLAYKGKLSWGWVATAAAALLGFFGYYATRPEEEERPLQPPPTEIPIDDVVNPIIEVAEGNLDEIREGIRDAEADEDRRERLERIAALNDGGRG